MTTSTKNDTRRACTKNYGFNHVNSVLNVAHVRFLVYSWVREFLNRENSAKAIRVHHSGKFAPRENNPLNDC